MRESDPQRNDLSRRKMLRTTGVATAAALGGAPVVSAAGGPARSGVYHVRGSRDAPVTEAQITEAVESAKADFVDRGGDLKKYTSYSVPAGDGLPVEFVYAIDDDGTPMSYGGRVGPRADPRTVERQAVSYAREMAKGHNPIAAERDDGVSTMESSWEHIGYHNWDVDDCPYGYITMNHDLYYCHEDLDSSKDLFGERCLYQSNPGIRSCGSSWYNSWGKPAHRWDYGDIGGYDLDDYDPYTDISGSQTVNVSLSSDGVATLGWSFEIKDVTIDDQGSFPNNYAKWKMTVNNTALEDEAITMEPGSSAWCWDDTNGTLLDVYGTTRWHKHTWCCTDTRTYTPILHVKI